MGELAVGQLGAAADVVDLPVAPLLGHELDAAAVVVDVQPVAHVQPVAVERHLAAVEQVRDEQRDDLLRELVRPVVVRAPGDADGQAVRAVVGAGEQVRARLGRRVRRVGQQRGGSRARRPRRSSRTPRRSRRARTGRRPPPSAPASSTWVPTTLVETKSAAPAIDRSTCDSAAKCTTTSAPASTVATVSASRMSPWTNSTSSARQVGARARVGEQVQHDHAARPRTPGRRRRRASGRSASR